MVGIALFVTLAIALERLQEILLGKKLSGWPLQIVTWIVGIGVCVLLKAGLFTTLGVGVLSSWGDYAVTGFIVGLGSNFVHIFTGNVEESVATPSK